MKKYANSCILGPILLAVLDILGGLPIGPQSTDLKNFEQFPTQNLNSKGVRFMKKNANRPLAEKFFFFETYFFAQMDAKKISAQTDERRRSY